MKTYYRAIPQTDLARPEGALTLAGGWTWFSHVEVMTREASPRVVPLGDVPAEVLDKMTGPRSAFGPLSMDEPQVMGILNVTPDSFSDGGRHNSASQAVLHAEKMVADGANLIDIGGESTRPGAVEVAVADEIDRTAPVIEAISGKIGVPISIDTRKAPVAEAALEAGAALVNDVAGFTFDAGLAPLCAERKVPVCVMHAQGDPATMQADPRYDDVLLDVYDFLEERVEWLVAQGVARDQIMVDPGIGFGKTIAHNLALLARISIFHSLGCPVLLGASRKAFIKVIGKAEDPMKRVSGSVAVALEGISQGVQVMRVHDVEETRQALQLWQAVTFGEYIGT